MVIEAGWSTMFDQISENDAQLDRNAFCQNMRSSRPSGCSTGTAPSTPINDPNWAPNGCGGGSLSAAIASILVGIPLPWLNLNHPATDVVFTPACNDHDSCYAFGEASRLTCDTNFSTAMGLTCNTSENPTCSSYQSAYHLAVRQFGASPYAQWAADRQCATWHIEMEANNCAKQ